jgi:DNA sulfur modification protein DndC
MRAGDINDDSNNEKKPIPGPYWLKQRQEWIKELLTIEKGIREGGHDIELIKREELQAIRQQWLRDPNEPDWADALPRIYAEVYPKDSIEWIENDAGAFTEPDAQLLEKLGAKHGVPPQLIMKLIEAELSVSGLGRRKGISNKLESILNKDWESLEEINIRNEEAAKHDSWKEKLTDLKEQYAEASAL